VRIILHDLDGGLDAMLCWGPSYECNLYWSNIFDVIDCMLSAWGSLELAPKFQKKPSSSDATSVMPSGVGCATRR